MTSQGTRVKKQLPPTYNAALEGLALYTAKTHTRRTSARIRQTRIVVRERMILYDEIVSEREGEGVRERERERQSLKSAHKSFASLHRLSPPLLPQHH